jgi:uncharacterized protein
MNLNQVYLCFKKSNACITQLLIYLLLCGMVSATYGAEKADFKIGEQLKTDPTNAALANEPYKKLNWEELTPADWDPLKPLKGLDLDKLQDSDPRARDALIAVGEAWKNAPIISALNGQRVKIAGFVVPLDINKIKVKEFLLVPYFGACIHVPPPPSNQVVHAFNAKTLSKEENVFLKKAALIQGPITLIGVMGTVQSSTSMGSAGYKILIDTIEEYKEPEK